MAGSGKEEDMMAHQLALDAGKHLDTLADAQLVVGEERYGSGDDYVTEESFAGLVDHARQRIDTYLGTIAKGNGNTETLLGDCANHLRFILAKYDQLKAQRQETLIRQE